jgi:glycosyltransferase involved in cell wall biosynthesis
MITGRDILILSTQDWGAMPTRKHRWARNWAKQGNRVLYVEQQMHWAGWLIDIRQQFTRAFRFLQGSRPIEENLWVFTLPIVLPFFQMSQAVNWLNNFFLAPVLRGTIRKLGFKNLILWTYTPHSADFVGKLGQSLTVYECVDEFSATKGLVHGATIAKMERELIEKVDQVIVTAPGLLESKRGLARRIELVPNGVDVEHFAKSSSPETVIALEIAAIPKPIIGYLGGVQYWVDFDLIVHAARQHPEWSFVFVGSIEPLARVDKVRDFKNMFFLGRKPYGDLPRYVKNFDVCINPYVLDGVGANVDPLKLYDYIASGKPVVSVNIPAAQRFADIMPLTQTADEFTRAIESVLKNPGDAARRMETAAAHSWSARFKKVEAAVEAASPK